MRPTFRGAYVLARITSATRHIAGGSRVLVIGRSDGKLHVTQAPASSKGVQHQSHVMQMHSTNMEHNEPMHWRWLQTRLARDQKGRRRRRIYAVPAFQVSRQGRPAHNNHNLPHHSHHHDHRQPMHLQLIFRAASADAQYPPRQSLFPAARSASRSIQAKAARRPIPRSGSPQTQCRPHS